MCVICHKPEGKPMPSDETIRKMFEHNPHGAGYALQGYIGKNGRFSVEYHKGFMKLEDFMKAIKSHGDLTNLNVVMHFRIKTHGETDAETTHPFRMSSNFEDLRKLNGQGHTVVFHNGTFSGLGGLSDERASDTQDWVIGVASKYLKTAKEPSKLQQKILTKLLDTCRVMVLYPSKTYSWVRYGDWKEKDGLFYSNLNWDSSYGYYGSYDRNYYDDYKYRKNQKKLSDGKSYSKSIIDVDRYGCNTAEFAWPSKDTSWLNARRKDRYEKIIRSGKEIGETDGWKIVQFEHSTVPEKKFYCLEDTYDILTEEMMENFSEKVSDTEIMYHLGADIDDDIIEFKNEDEVAEFIAEAIQTGEYTYQFARKEWYLDTVNYLVITEQGVRELYKPGEIGHVLRYLKQYGVDDKWLLEEGGNPYYHDKGGIIDQEEFDEIPMSPVDQDLDDIYDDELDRIAGEVDKAYGLA